MGKISKVFGLGMVLACSLAASGCSTINDTLFGDSASDDQAATAAPAAPAAQSMPVMSARDAARLASLRCESISDEHAWLNCYYGAVQPVRAELGLVPAPAAQVNAVPSSR